MIDTWLDTLSRTLTLNPYLAPLLALLAGLLTAFTPCSLSSVPLVIAYVGGTAGDSKKRAFRYSLVFCIGTAVTFTVLGTLASLLGRIMSSGGSWWYISLGVLMTLMALQTWEVVQVIPQNGTIGKNPRRGYLGAGIAGMLAGLFASPCATPVLVVLLAMVARQGQLLTGVFLLLMYSVGHSILFMIAGTSVGFVRRVTAAPSFARYHSFFKAASGFVILLLAGYMFYLGF